MKKFFAVCVDILISFMGFGYIIGLITGQTSSSGFKLSGLPALFLLVLIFAYFFLSKKYFGGTLGQKIFGLKKD